MAFLPRGHCLFGYPRAIIYNTKAFQRMSSFRCPRKAKLIFLEPCSGNVAHFSSTAPCSPWAQVQTPHSGSQASANRSNLISSFSTITFCSSEASCLPASQPNRALTPSSRPVHRPSGPHPSLGFPPHLSSLFQRLRAFLGHSLVSKASFLVPRTGCLLEMIFHRSQRSPCSVGSASSQNSLGDISADPEQGWDSCSMNRSDWIPGRGSKGSFQDRKERLGASRAFQSDPVAV